MASPVKILINNFEKPNMYLHNPIKILISDFPLIFGFTFFTEILTKCMVIIKFIYRLIFKSNLFLQSYVKYRHYIKLIISSNVKLKTSYVYRGKIKFKPMAEIYLYTLPKIAQRLRLKPVVLKIYPKIIFNIIRVMYFYKIYEKRNQLIKDQRNLTIKDFIMVEQY